MVTLPAWFDIAACRPDAFGPAVIAWVPSGDLDAEIAAARAAHAAGVRPGDRRYASFFRGVEMVPPPPTIEARDICERCPVRAECLAWSCRFDLVGLFGGCGDADRRVLRGLLDLDSTCDAYRAGCGCGFCAAVDMFSSTAEGGRPHDRNGPDATCGRIATYGRGCRCRACRWAMAVQTRRSRFADDGDAVELGAAA